jgi:hypothetical protein
MTDCLLQHSSTQWLFSQRNVLSLSLSLSLSHTHTHTHTHIKSSTSPLEEKFNGKCLLAFLSFSLGFSSLFLCVFNQVFYMLPFAGKINVPPRLQDRGTRVRGDAQGGRVEAPPNFKDFMEMGDKGTSHI